MSGLGFLDASTRSDVSMRLAREARAEALGAPRDITAGELDALMRTHRITLVCSGSHYTARQTDGRFERHVIAERTMGEAVLGLVAKLEGRS